MGGLITEATAAICGTAGTPPELVIALLAADGVAVVVSGGLIMRIDFPTLDRTFNMSEVVTAPSRFKSALLVTPNPDWPAAARTFKTSVVETVAIVAPEDTFVLATRFPK